MFSFLFDTNSVRDFGRTLQTEGEWASLWAAWTRSGYRTAWIPWTIGEITGTNLMRKNPPITADFCAETSLAVSRFDQLTEGRVLTKFGL